jgi:hypothetical protein
MSTWWIPPLFLLLAAAFLLGAVRASDVTRTARTRLAFIFTVVGLLLLWQQCR